jgi:hypothetical protein
MILNIYFILLFIKVNSNHGDNLERVSTVTSNLKMHVRKELLHSFESSGLILKT